LIDFWDVFFSFSIKKRIRLPRLDRDFEKFTQFHSIHEIWLTWSRSKSFLAQNTSYHIHMRNIAYRCDTKITSLNRSTKKHIQYYVYIRFNAYTRSTVMQLQNEFFKSGCVFCSLELHYCVHMRYPHTYVRNTEVTMDRHPRMYVRVMWLVFFTFHVRIEIQWIFVTTSLHLFQKSM
jgi:hypothetical protein